MKTKLLIFTIALLLPMQLVYAQPVPEPGPICPAGTTVKNNVCVIASTDCGEGTTYQDGICVVNTIENSTKSSSDKWDTIPENTDFKFEIWPTESIVRHDDFPTIEFTLSPIPSGPFESFYIEEIDELVPEKRILVQYSITDPQGMQQTEIGHFHLDDLTQGFTKVSFGTPIGGEYIISGTISWQTNGELFTIPSNSITVTSIEPIFRGMTEKISIDKPWNNIKLLDWSPDGESILITYVVLRDDDSGFPRLATMSPDGTNVITLDIPILSDYDNGIYLAKFSPDEKFIHFIVNGDNLFRYDLKTSQVLQQTHYKSGVSYFDYYHYYEDNPETYSIVILVENEKTSVNSEDFMLLDIGDGEQEKAVSNAEALIHNFESNKFDISPDGKKILFKKTIDAGYGWADRILAYYPAQGDVVEIPNNQVSCGPPPKWSPDGEMIIYSVNSCGRSAPGGTLHLISVDGTYHEVLLPYTNNNPDDFVVSPDGNYIIYGVGNDFEKMTLVQPIPEFEIIVGLVLAVSMIPIILARKQLILR